MTAGVGYHSLLFSKTEQSGTSIHFSATFRLPDRGDKMKKQIHELDEKLTVIESSPESGSSRGACDEVICLDDSKLCVLTNKRRAELQQQESSAASLMQGTYHGVGGRQQMNHRTHCL
jgi:hypothetical protein